MEDIPMIGEIGYQSLVDSSYYMCYPTEIHKANNSPWFFPGLDLRQIKKLSEEHINHIMWGNGTK